ncbi:MAG TPA: HAD-IA family hydrolase [Blastocatellia bacterium]|nr:HAD-IA family hydrolase [Blastocatellia bacterium]
MTGAGLQHDFNSIRAIFFDAGGTLIHLDSARICDLINDEFGFRPQTDRFRHAQYLGMSRVAELVAEGKGSTEKLKREFYSTLLPQVGVSEDKLRAVVDCVLKLAEAEMLWYVADDRAAETLSRLNERGFKLGLVSNSDGRIESAVTRAGLARYLDFFIDSFLVGVEKPDPRIFHFACERAGVAPHEAAYVGDLYHVDVIGSRGAGLVPVLYDPYDLNRAADCLRINSLDDLLIIASAGGDDQRA